MIIFETDPKPELNQQTSTPSRTLRIYESSVEGSVTVCFLRDASGPAIGLRVDRDQLADLHLALDAYLGETCA